MRKMDCNMQSTVLQCLHCLSFFVLVFTATSKGCSMLIYDLDKHFAIFFVQVNWFNKEPCFSCAGWWLNEKKKWCFFCCCWSNNMNRTERIQNGKQKFFFSSTKSKIFYICIISIWGHAFKFIPLKWNIVYIPTTNKLTCMWWISTNRIHIQTCVFSETKNL